MDHGSAADRQRCEGRESGAGNMNSCIRLLPVGVKDTYYMPREWMSVQCLYSCSQDYYYHETAQL